VTRFWPLLCAPLFLGAQVNVLTANYGNQRTSANLNEKILTTRNVHSQSFGKVGAFPVDGQIYAQPLYVSRLDMGAAGTHNVVYVATMHDTIYALDADTLTPLWQRRLGDPVPSVLLDFDDVDPETGILSTPVIDLARNAIYLVTDTLENSAPVFRLHALDLTNGQELLNGPVEILASAMGAGQASQDGVIVLDPWQHLQRPGLLLANGAVYLGFASHSDLWPYHGWILAYDAANLQHQIAAFNTTPQGGAGGIWQAGRGLAASAAGDLYVATGNGDYDGISNFGESFLRLSPSLSLIDWFAPADWQPLSDNDYDLGSIGPVLLPSAGMLVGGDKAGDLYGVSLQNMGHLGTPGAATPQSFQPFTTGIFNVALWDRADSAALYVVESGVSTMGFNITNGVFATQPFSQSPVTSDYPYQGIALSANGSAPQSGILWITAGDHSQADVPGTLIAYSALDLTQVLWTSDFTPERDTLGAFAKFATPTIANGRVYVPTFSNQLVVYGMLGRPPRAGPAN